MTGMRYSDVLPAIRKEMDPVYESLRGIDLRQLNDVTQKSVSEAAQYAVVQILSAQDDIMPDIIRRRMLSPGPESLN